MVCVDQTHCRLFDPLLEEPYRLENIRIYIARNIGLHFYHWHHYGSIFVPIFQKNWNENRPNFFLMGPVKLSISARVTFRPFKVIWGHWFWYQSKRIGLCDFLLVRRSNLGPILHRFRDLQVFVLTIPPVFHPILGVPVGPDHRCWGQSEQVLKAFRP